MLQMMFIGRDVFLSRLRLSYILVILLLILPICPYVARALDFSMSASHFGEVMEFWYQKPSPETLKSLLSAVNRAGLLRRPEKQLFFAAFFSRLLKSGQMRPTQLLEYCKGMGENCKRMASWSLHLAGMDAAAKNVIARKDANAVLLDQIKSTPPNLSAWEIGEPAIVDMYLAAFMADGNAWWLEKILDCALRDHDNFRDAMKRKTALAAAAALYEYGPRHPVILKALKDRIRSGKNDEVLNKLLEHAASSHKP